MASYGKQIGIITEVLLSLANEVKPKDLEAVKKLKEIQIKAEDIKAEKKVHIQKNAKQLLDKLEQSDPEALNELLKKYK